MVVGQLFGIVGILLAVPILTALVVLVQELWVLPREDPGHGGQRRPDETGQPHDGRRGRISTALSR